MLQSQVKKTIAERSLIRRKDKVLVCVSGGPDSTALLHLLISMRDEYQIDLAVAHLDHMIRGRHSKRDAEFVKRLTLKKGLPFIYERIPVERSLKINKLSLEETAREARYAFYGRAAEKCGADKIATGHTMDDQAETVMMRLLKGAGSRGLSGIPYKRRLGKRWVIRPLLDTKREDIEKYLRERRIPSRTDATNFETRYLRNKIRHILMPLLEKEFNPNVKENLSFIAMISGAEFDYLNDAARRKAKKIANSAGAAVTVGIKKLLRQHIALRRLITRNIIESLKGDLRKIGYRHWQGIEAILSDARKTHLDLPGGIKAQKMKDEITFSKKAAGRVKAEKQQKVRHLDIPGELRMPELGMKLHSEIVGAVPKFKKGKKRKRVEYINGDAVSAPLLVRTWRSGDRMRPFGMRSYKKLHDIFIDEKTPREMRSSIPLVLSKNKILWAAGLKISEHCRVTGDVKKIIKLSISPLADK